MKTANREYIEMTIQNLHVELENLCQAIGSFNTVDVLALQDCQTRLKQLIQRENRLLNVSNLKAVA